MKKRNLIVFLFLIASCDSPSHPITTDNKIADSSDIPNVTYSVVNFRTDNGGQFYDIYVKDTTQIRTLNSYLKKKYKNASDGWIQVNYFDDSVVAKSYFDKQLDNNVSDKEKDRLFRSYIGNYKYNPTTKYDSLVYEH
jgi:hypothetical protein